jgi:outer membrane lipoprotein-sorting protein
MKKIFLIVFFLILTKNSFASMKQNIITKLTEVENISFEFEQNINGKIENGKCIIEYPRKINCKYNSGNKKILISNGKSLVIKTLSSYYIYPLKKTPLNTILDKDFLLKKNQKLKRKRY